MKYLVIGHFCYDVAHLPGQTEVEYYGGIFRCVETFSQLAAKNDTITPVFGVSRGDYPSVVQRLEQLPGVDPSAVFKLDCPTNRVHVYPAAGGATVTCSRDIAPPIPYEKIRRHLSVNGILVNMISGRDLELETLDHIRMTVRAHHIPIHFDYHNLTLGVDERHERFRRPVPEWRRWAFMIDTIQINEAELAGLPPDTMTEDLTVGHLLTLGVKGVLLTRGSSGVSMYKSEHKRVVRQDFASIPVDHAGEVPGAGDVFGAAFVHAYVSTSDLASAAEAAARKAEAFIDKELRRPQ